MKKLYILTILGFFFSATIVAQDKEWSVEVNYPFSVGDVINNVAPGVIDLGIKYRFLDLNTVKIGAGLNVGAFNTNLIDTSDIMLFDIEETNWLIQPKIFAELNIPRIPKLHPSIGFGYTFLESKYEGSFSNETINNTYSEGGFNANIGLSYDIVKRFFLQVQYDYVRTKGDYIFEEDIVVVKQNLEFIKLGVGFRF